MALETIGRLSTANRCAIDTARRAHVKRFPKIAKEKAAPVKERLIGVESLSASKPLGRTLLTAAFEIGVSPALKDHRAARIGASRPDLLRG